MVILRVCVDHRKPLIQHLAARIVRIISNACVCVCARVAHIHALSADSSNASVNIPSVKCPDVTGCGASVALPPASVPASGLNICTCAECVTVPGSGRSSQPDRWSPAAVSGNLHSVARTARLSFYGFSEGAAVQFNPENELF